MSVCCECCVCCDVEASESDVSECDRESSRMRRPWFTGAVAPWLKKGFLPSHKITRIFWQPKFHCLIHNSSPPIPIQR